MDVADLSDYFIDEYIRSLENRTSGEFWPPQSEAIRKGLVSQEWQSFLISAPHGSGKTLVAELATVKALYDDPNALILYLVPYKAMAKEIRKRFLFLEDQTFGKRVSIWTGDQAIDDDTIIGSNFIVMTYELFQLLLRTDLNKFKNIALIIIDELHFIEESGRGAKQEAAITRLLTLSPRPPILALSAPVSNIDDIRNWLDCGDYVVATDWRRNPLYEGIVNPASKHIEFYRNANPEGEEPIPMEDEDDRHSICIQSIIHYLRSNKGDFEPQVLIFVPFRRTARETAQMISDELANHLVSGDIDLSEEDIKTLMKELDGAQHSSPRVLKSFERLFSTGVAYHHAGLGRNLRALIEKQFRERRLIVLVATTTLAIGVNLPASRVYFLEPKAAYASLSPIKYRNMAGRAGRPAYQERGESVIICESIFDMNSSLDNYILSPDITLKSRLLLDRPAATGALLSWISQGINSFSEIERILSKIFKPPRNTAEENNQLKSYLVSLKNYQFIEMQKTDDDYILNCTPLGHAVATCGARPDDSSFLIKNLIHQNLTDEEGNLDQLSALFVVCLTSRFDGMFLGKDVLDEEIYNQYLSKIDKTARPDISSQRNRERMAFFDAFLLRGWISGKTQDEIAIMLDPDHSAEEVVERLVPNAIEMLNYYLTIVEKSSVEHVESTTDMVDNIRKLRDCLQLGCRIEDLNLARMFARREDVRRLVSRLNKMGISSPEELVSYPYDEFSPETARMEERDFYYAKRKALYIIEDLEERRRAYVELFASRRGLFDGTLEKMLAGGSQFENGIREAVHSFGTIWNAVFAAQQARDTGAGSDLPHPEAYLVSKNANESIRICFEAKHRRDGKPIESSSDALSPLTKCTGDTSHRITIGWPSFSKRLHRVAVDRAVVLFDSTTFALLYVWINADYISTKQFLSSIDKSGILQPDAFEPFAPRWWPKTGIG